MHLYYRISDKSYEKPKLIGATKEVCLMNFILAFHELIFGSEKPENDYNPPIKIIADRCERKTIKMIQETGLPLAVTDDGNAGSLINTIQMAIDSHSDDEILYFCEDDYLHLGSSENLIREGLEHADYISLYDHPDKYTRFYNMGEYSKVIKTKSSHWRYTISTCMTFGTTVKTIKEDIDIWKKHTDTGHPKDHLIFTELGQIGRKLIIPIPGVACHTDLWLSGNFNQILIDDWAIELMIRQLTNELGQNALDKSVVNKNGWEKLVALDAIKLNLKK